MREGAEARSTTFSELVLVKTSENLFLKTFGVSRVLSGYLKGFSRGYRTVGSPATYFRWLLTGSWRPSRNLKLFPQRFYILSAFEILLDSVVDYRV